MSRLDHPYHNLTGGRWLRGNLHAHTTRSDGRHSPQALVDAYAALGSGFLAFAAHDICAPPTELPRDDPRGMVVLPGNEITQGGPHMCHIGADRRLEPDWRRQKVIDQANEGPGFIVINHPNWQQHFDHMPISMLELLKCFTGIEIFNGIMQSDEGSAYALMKWDIMLASGRRLWGFANDDTHGPEFVGQGWNVAYVYEHTVSGVMEALREGRFYASTGVTITAIEVSGMHVRIVTENASRFVGGCADAKRFACVDDRVLETTVPADAGYARFTCWGDGERFAWTQPMWVTEEQ